VGKVDQFNYTVNHGIAKSDQGVHKTKLQAVDHLIKKVFQ